MKKIIAACLVGALLCGVVGCKKKEEKKIDEKVMKPVMLNKNLLLKMPLKPVLLKPAGSMTPAQPQESTAKAGTFAPSKEPQQKVLPTQAKPQVTDNSKKK